MKPESITVGLISCVVGDVAIGVFRPALIELGVPPILVLLMAVAPWIGLLISIIDQ